MHKVEIHPGRLSGRWPAAAGCIPLTISMALTAFVVVDLQNGFMAPGHPAEVAQDADHGTTRAISARNLARRVVLA
jgi:hypothetical protein